MIKAKTISEIRDEMVDREAIRDCLFRYSHAIDRYQLDILRTVYWPDAIDDHSGFKGNPEGFIAWATEGIKTFEHLPNGYAGDSLTVLYHCTYPGSPTKKLAQDSIQPPAQQPALQQPTNGTSLTN